MYYKEGMAILAILLTFAAFVPYIRLLLRNEIKPHYFSWMIWGFVTLTVCIAQLQDDGGVGAWPIGISGLITMVVVVLSLRHRKTITITRMDWAFLIIATSSLPVWMLTSDPLWAVIILTAVEVLGFGPSIRKAYYHPYEENVTFFVLFFIRNIVAVFALEHYSVTTMLFPLVASAACCFLIVTIVWRRTIVPKQQASSSSPSR